MQSVEKVNLTNLKKCSQVWEEMTPNDKGRICGKCKNTIIDFRNLTDKEVAEIHVFTEGRVCGVYNKEQFELKLPKRKRNRLKSIYIGLIGMLFSPSLIGQENGNPVKTEQTEIDYDKVKQEARAVSKSQEIKKDSIVISGRLTDEAGEKLIYANVHIKGTRIGTTSDSNGFYHLNITEQIDSVDQIALVFSYTGYTTEERIIEKGKIKEQRELNVTFLYEAQLINFGVVTRRPFHKRVWYGIKNIFRRKR